MARHGYGKTIVDSYVVVPQRSAVCMKCQSRYQGADTHVKCRGCGTKMETLDVGCKKKIPTGVWNVTTMRSSAKGS